MKFIEKKLQAQGKYTNYQIKQIIFLTKSISADISKVIILSILFYNHLTEYLIALTVLFVYRTYSGGLHFNTYLGCLIATGSYFYLAIIVLPLIHIPFLIKFLLLNTCMVIFSKLTPVTSKYRPPLSSTKIILCQNITTTITFLYIIILYIMPENPYITIGFWIIILHLLQLIFAKFLATINKRKGGTSTC